MKYSDYKKTIFSLKSRYNRKPPYTLLLIVSMLLFGCSNHVVGQNTFEVVISSMQDENSLNFIQDTEGDYVGIIWKSSTDDYIPKSYIYKINFAGDTISQIFVKPDTNLKLRQLVQSNTSPVEYMITGTGYHKDSSDAFWFSYFVKTDQNLDIIWEKTYQLYNNNFNYCTPHFAELLKLKGNGFLHANSLNPNRKMILFQLSDEGDSVAYRMYEGDSSGSVHDLMYNYDSTSYLLHTHFAHYSNLNSSTESQCITVDFDLQQTKVDYYPYGFADGTAAKMLPGGNLVAGSRIAGYFNWEFCNYIGAYKLDTNFVVLDSCFITHPDTMTRVGYNSLDFYDPNCIYFGGENNPQMSTWSPQPCWYVVARVDSNMNLIFEKYIGDGVSNYAFPSVTASDDGGVLITGGLYNSLLQDYERDVLIIKLDSSDFTVGNGEHKFTIVSDAIVYPNPGGDAINIRTSLTNVWFELIDIHGNIIITKHINNLITNINARNLVDGIYMWQIKSKNDVFETGKWIKK